MALLFPDTTSTRSPTQGETLGERQQTDAAADRGLSHRRARRWDDWRQARREGVRFAAASRATESEPSQPASLACWCCGCSLTVVLLASTFCPQPLVVVGRASILLLCRPLSARRLVSSSLCLSLSPLPSSPSHPSLAACLFRRRSTSSRGGSGSRKQEATAPRAVSSCPRRLSALQSLLPRMLHPTPSCCLARPSSSLP